MTKPRRKLIFFWTYREWGGAQIYLIAIMKLAKVDWDITVVLPRESSQEIIQYLNEVGVSIELIDTYIDLGAAPTIRRKLERQWLRIRSEYRSLQHLSRFDLANSVLHIETSPWQSWIFLTILLLKKANIFVTLHNAPTAPSQLRRSIWRFRMRFLSTFRRFHLFTSNHDTKNKIKDLVRHNFWNRINVTYTCVDPEQISEISARSFDKIEAKRRFSIELSDLIVLTVGQFIDRKGRWVLLDAARSVITKRQNISFVWISPQMPTDDEFIRIDEFGLGDKFKIVLSSNIGSSRDEILAFFQIADIFVLPSYVEGLPIALLEAMALGLPCISTNVYAIPEAITDGKTGLLIEPGDAKQLENAIELLSDDERLRTSLSESGKDRVLRDFDERVASGLAIKNYEECFANAE